MLSARALVVEQDRRHLYLDFFQPDPLDRTTEVVMESSAADLIAAEDLEGEHFSDRSRTSWQSLSHPRTLLRASVEAWLRLYQQLSSETDDLRYYCRKYSRSSRLVVDQMEKVD